MIVPYGEYAPDLPEIGGIHATVAQNVIPLEDGYLAYQNDNQVSSGGLGAACMGSICAAYGASTYETFAGTSAALKRMVVGGAITDVSKGGGYSLPAGYWWDFAQYGNYILAVNGGVSGADNPQAWNLGVSALFADLAGSPPKATAIGVVRDFVVLGATYDAVDGQQPLRVRWSAINDSTSWTKSPATQADQQDLTTEGGPVQRVIGGDYGVVIQVNAISRMDYVGPPILFKFSPILRNVGTLSPRASIKVNDDVFLYSTNGFCRIGPDGVEWIGANRVDNTFRRLIGATGISQVIAGADARAGCIVWIYGSVNVASTPHTSAFVYNFKTKRWSTLLLSSFAMNDAHYVFPTALTSSTNEFVLGAWAGTTRSFKPYSTDQSNGVTSVLETAGIQLSDGRFTMVKRIESEESDLSDSAQAVITSMAVLYKNRASGAAWTATTVSPTNATQGLYECRINARYHKFRRTGGGLGLMHGVRIIEARPTSRF